MDWSLMTIIGDMIQQLSEQWLAFREAFPDVSNFVLQKPVLAALIGSGFMLASHFFISALIRFPRLLGVVSSSSPGSDDDLDFTAKRIPLDRIYSSPYQPRWDIKEDKLKELETSIHQYGIITPIQVTPIETDRYQIVAGHRRVEAARNLGMDTIPALVKDYSEEELMEIGFLENLQREDMGLVDKTEMYMHFRTEFQSLTDEELSNLIGKPVEEIKGREWIFDLPGVTKQALNSGFIKENLARVMTELDEEKHRDIIEFIAREAPSESELRDKLRTLSNESLPLEDLEGPVHDTDSLLKGTSSETERSSTIQQFQSTQ